MPSNTTSGTADVISALPFSVSVDPLAGNVNLWYVYTHSGADDWISILGCANGTYAPEVWLYTPNAVTNVQSQLDQKPFIWKVEDGVTYYFKVADPSSTYSSGNAVTFSIEASPKGQITTGQLLIPNDQAFFPGAVLDPTTGEVVALFEGVHGENGAVLPSGTFAMENSGDRDEIKIYDKNFALIATTLGASFTGGGRPHITTDERSTFYVAQSQPTATDPAVVTTISNQGDLGATSWTLPANSAGLLNIGLSRDRTILYYVKGSFGGVVHRFDLENNVAVSDVGMSISTFAPAADIRVRDDESLLAAWDQGDGSHYVIRLYAFSGALIREFHFSDSGTLDHFVLADDEQSFYAWFHAPDAISHFKQVRISDGAILNTFDSPQFNSGVGPHSDDCNPVRWGAPDSCPLMLLRGTLPVLVDESVPCCPEEPSGCECPPSVNVPGNDGSPSSQPIPSSTGPVLPPAVPIGPVDILSDPYWTALCAGGGEVPLVADPVDVESWVS